MARPIELPSPWRELAAKHGGSLRLARVCGVSYSTLHRWVYDGMRPEAERRYYIQCVFADAGLECPL